MSRFLTKRILALVPILLGVSVVTFGLLLLVPGDPVLLLLGDGATPEAISKLREQLHLEGRVDQRFFAWLWLVLQGDFGTSIATGQPAGDVMSRAIENTSVLAIAAILISIVVGVPLGLLLAVLPGAAAKPTNFGVVSAMSIPSFWLGLILLYVFAVKHTWFPTGGMEPITGESDLTTRLHYLALPAIAVAVLPAALVARLTRALVLELRRQDFVLMLETRGYGRLRIWRHLVRNAAPGIVNIVGLQAGDIFLGAVFVELVFSWPGVGSTVVSAIAARDYPVIQAVVLATAVIFAIITLLTDVTMRLLDPRMAAHE